MGSSSGMKKRGLFARVFYDYSQLSSEDGNSATSRTMPYPTSDFRLLRAAAKLDLLGRS